MGEKRILPAVALRGLTVMPDMVAHFDIAREKSVKAVEEAMRNDRMIFLITQKDMEVSSPLLKDLYEIGVIARINQVIKLPGKNFRIMVEGGKRAALLSLFQDDPYLECEVEARDRIPEESFEDDEEEAMVRVLEEKVQSYALASPKMNKDIAARLMTIRSLVELVGQACVTIPLPFEKRQELLERETLKERYELLLDILEHEISIAQIEALIQDSTRKRVDANQKEYYLREQMKAISHELGEDSVKRDIAMYEAKLGKLKASAEVKEKIADEIRKLNQTGNTYTSEVGIIRTYIETMLEMPWNKKTRESINLEKAAAILDEDHYGLENVKKRVLEYLAVRILTRKGDSPIICLVGPPGTGKTSIARSISRALDRKYVRMSLGGVRDEAEIRGHRKTYVGAMPGRIADAMKQAGVCNPLILLDEVDKVSSDYKGDVSSALLEVLDSEQNCKFRDNYLEVPLDLSQVMFIATANTMETIPRPLLDRMDIIEVNSYTENEKMHIALDHLIPKQINKNGLQSGQLTITQDAVEEMILSYTREAGVRQLERKIGEICRKAARTIVENDRRNISVARDDLETFLGKEKYRRKMKNEEDQIGIVRGLAWTSAGGDTLQIEVNVMEGKGEILLTGHLGDVMKESAQTGISYLRSIASEYGIKPEYFKEHDIHVHIPEGAVPKDGPSAGITMATAMLSAMIGRKVRCDVAMTGEITLRGRVLPIGGLKEKLLAARNAGIKKVLVPFENLRDVEEISEEITDGLEIVYARGMSEVLKEAFA